MKRERNLTRDLGLPERMEGRGPHAPAPERIAALTCARLRSAEPERKEWKMFKSKKLTTVLAVAAAALALSIGAYAAGSAAISRWDSGSAAVPKYTALPSAEACVKDVGYVPVLIESFDNGYVFAEGSVVNNTLRNESLDVVEKFRSLHFEYVKNGDRVYFSQDRYSSDMGSDTVGSSAATVSGVDIRYHRYENRFVPADYALTEADRQAEANGVVFSYGADEAQTVVVQGVQWEDGDMHYSLTQLDGALSEAELVSMAEQILRTE